jgi:hypothetical protein
MDHDKKITLSLFLTWVVFGLFNLFGQPEAFVPPIIVDGLIIAGLGIYFLFPFQRNYFQASIICFTSFVLVLSIMELGWIKTTNFTIIIASCINILLIVYLMMGLFSIVKSDKKIVYLLLIIIITHSMSILIAIFNFLPDYTFLPMIIYSCSGIAAIASLLLIKNDDPTSISLKRFYLLISLHYFFDIGNYLALLQFTTN